MRRIYSVLTVILAAAFILSACATPTSAPAVNAAPTSAPAANATSVAPAATVAQAPATSAAPVTANKVLTLIDPVISTDWSPLRGGGQNVRQLSLWWAPPVWADMSGTLHPMVFASWSSSEDFKTWTLKIDPKAVFSDGSAITAEDVKGTWELSTQPLTKHQRVSLFLSGIVGYADAVAGKSTTLPGIVAQDAQTVVVSLTAADPIFINRIATNLIGPVKISQARNADGQEISEWWLASNHPATSGPYMPTEMNLTTGSVTFVPNPKWWGGTPKLSEIKIIAMEDGAAAELVMEKGQADINMSSDLPDTFAKFGADFVGTNLPATPVLQYFWINSTVAPMDDLNCRKALTMAADPTSMFQASHPNGPGKAGTTLLAQLLGAKETNTPVTNDPAGAKAAFALCKYKDAMPKIYVGGTSNPQAVIAAQVLVEEWRQVLGITETELVPSMDSLPKSEQGKVQVFRNDVGTRVFDTTTLLLGSVYSGSSTAISNMGGYKNEAVDKLILDASVLSPSDANRDLKALEAEKLAMADFVFIPWYDEGPTMHAMPWVLNYSRNLDWQIVEPWNLDLDLSKRP